MKFTPRNIALAAVVGAAYCALTLLVAPIAFGVVQFRVSEALCILPAFFPMSAWGLWIGCALANVFGGYGVMDIVFGSLATLCSGLCIAAIARNHPQPLSLGRCVLVCFMPVLWNTPIVGSVIAYSTGAFWAALPLTMLQFAVEEAGVMYILGLPLMKLLPKSSAFMSLAKA